MAKLHGKVKAGSQPSTCPPCCLSLADLDGSRSDYSRLRKAIDGRTNRVRARTDPYTFLYEGTTLISCSSDKGQHKELP